MQEWLKKPKNGETSSEEKNEHMTRSNAQVTQQAKNEFTPGTIIQ